MTVAEGRFNSKPLRPVRIIVCGSRDWTDAKCIEAELEHIQKVQGVGEVIHGAARGVDSMAGSIARRMGIKVSEFPADWKGYGKAAGHLRNITMLGEKPDFVLAFKGGFNWKLDRGGTEHMVKIALAADIPARVIDRSGHRISLEKADA